MLLSVIIPTYNEEKNITHLLAQLCSSRQLHNIEILVIDGGSTDKTKELAEKHKINFYTSPQKGRSSQLSFGAMKAKGEVLYFLHADTVPQSDYYTSIYEAIAHGLDAGCFSYQFDSDKPMLKINSYLTKFNAIWAGGGDQSLFITRTCYDELGGYNTDLIIMEDFEFVKRIKKAGCRFGVVDKPLRVNARKFEKNSWLKVQIVNLVIVLAWKFGASQTWLKDKYSKWLKW